MEVTLPRCCNSQRRKYRCWCLAKSSCITRLWNLFVSLMHSPSKRLQLEIPRQWSRCCSMHRLIQQLQTPWMDSKPFIMQWNTSMNWWCSCWWTKGRPWTRLMLLSRKPRPFSMQWSQPRKTKFMVLLGLSSWRLQPLVLSVWSFTSIHHHSSLIITHRSRLQNLGGFSFDAPWTAGWYLERSSRRQGYDRPILLPRRLYCLASGQIRFWDNVAHCFFGTNRTRRVLHHKEASNGCRKNTCTIRSWNPKPLKFMVVSQPNPYIEKCLLYQTCIKLFVFVRGTLNRPSVQRSQACGRGMSSPCSIAATFRASSDAQCGGSTSANSIALGCQCSISQWAIIWCWTTLIESKSRSLVTINVRGWAWDE